MVLSRFRYLVGVVAAGCTGRVGGTRTHATAAGTTSAAAAATAATVGKMRSVGDRVRFARRLFPADPSDQWHGRRGLGRRQQRRPDKVLEFLREVRVTQKYVGPKRASMFRVDHRRTPASHKTPHRCARQRRVRPAASRVTKFQWFFPITHHIPTHGVVLCGGRVVKREY